MIIEAMILCVSTFGIGWGIAKLQKWRRFERQYTLYHSGQSPINPFTGQPNPPKGLSVDEYYEKHGRLRTWRD